jgi:hypothetical protein
MAALLAALLAGCAGPAASFTSDGPCVADGRAPGLYPDLEALLPGGLGETGATTVDSGRSCSDQRLGTLKAHGVTDLRYAGATWTPEDGGSTVIAVFTTPAGAPALEAGWMEEFYESSARASTKTENIEISHPSYEEAGEVYRLDTLNELSYQTVLVWPGGSNVVHVVIVATQLEPGGPGRADHDNGVRIAALWAARGRSG